MCSSHSLLEISNHTCNKPHNEAAGLQVSMVNEGVSLSAGLISLLNSRFREKGCAVTIPAATGTATGAGGAAAAGAPAPAISMIPVS